MTTVEILKNAIDMNKQLLKNYYEDPTDTRNECDPEIEQIRTNILNLQIMYLKKTTGITDIEELIDLASCM